MYSGVPKTAPSARGADPSRGARAEIQDLHEVFAAAARRQEDVVALQVAVYDAQIVRARESGAHLLEDIDARASGIGPRASSLESEVPTSTP